MDNKTRVAITGTRKDENDFYDHIIREHHFPVHHEQALTLIDGRFPDAMDVTSDHELEVVTWEGDLPGTYSYLECPDWTLGALLYELLWHRSDFEAEMQNNPLPAEARYFEGWHEIEDFDVSELNIYAFVDPAVGKTEMADFFAIILCVIWGQKLYVIDGMIRKGLTMAQQVKAIEFFNNKYPGRISEILIEANFHQAWMAQEAHVTMHNIVGIRHRMKKEERISALDFPFRASLIWFFKSFPGLAEMHNQFLKFDGKPSTPTKKDDGLDALATAFQRLKNNIKSEKLVFVNI